MLIKQGRKRKKPELEVIEGEKTYKKVLPGNGKGKWKSSTLYPGDHRYHAEDGIVLLPLLASRGDPHWSTDHFRGKTDSRVECSWLLDFLNHAHANFSVVVKGEVHFRGKNLEIIDSPRCQSK